MSAITFTVPGLARAKGRPRFGRTKSGITVAYTDAKTASYENLVALAAEQAMGERKPFAEPVIMTIRVRLTPPASASKATRAAMLDGRWPPAKRPDLDNVLKGISDGLNGVAYTDDALIVCLTGSKVYALTPGVDVVIERYAPPVSA
jgi:Holliday junction resolvase RusA-like endonuclease